jgi:hypothetical protein
MPRYSADRAADRPGSTDGRAKLLVMTARAQAEHAAILQTFAEIENELTAAVEPSALQRIRDIPGDIVCSFSSIATSPARDRNAPVPSTVPVTAQR